MAFKPNRRFRNIPVRIVGGTFRVLTTHEEAGLLAAAGHSDPIGRLPGAPPPLTWLVAEFPDRVIRPVRVEEVV